MQQKCQNLQSNSQETILILSKKSDEARCDLKGYVNEKIPKMGYGKCKYINAFFMD